MQITVFNSMKKHIKNKKTKHEHPIGNPLADPMKTP
jgi:hypothetical protein